MIGQIEFNLEVVVFFIWFKSSMNVSNKELIICFNGSLLGIFRISWFVVKATLENTT